jgi:hypothetical protein
MRNYKLLQKYSSMQLAFEKLFMICGYGGAGR